MKDSPALRGPLVTTLAAMLLLWSSLSSVAVLVFAQAPAGSPITTAAAPANALSEWNCIAPGGIPAGGVSITWGFKESDATWACNQWRDPCKAARGGCTVSKVADWKCSTGDTVTITWGYTATDAAWACNQWRSKCKGGCTATPIYKVVSEWNCFTQGGVPAGGVSITWGFKESDATWACNQWRDPCKAARGGCTVGTVADWRCSTGDTVTLTWGYNAGDAAWACNQWRSNCKGGCTASPIFKTPPNPPPRPPPPSPPPVAGRLDNEWNQNQNQRNYLTAILMKEIYGDTFCGNVGYLGVKSCTVYTGPADTRYAVLTSLGSTRTFLVFRGSKSLQNWITNIESRSAERVTFGTNTFLMASGFFDAWNGVVVQIREALAACPGEIIVTGHSLGGALASIAGYSLKARGFRVAGVYTFASPFVGKADWKRLYDSQGIPTYRIHDPKDCVTNVPVKGPWPDTNWEHVGVPTVLCRKVESQDLCAFPFNTFAKGPCLAFCISVHDKDLYLRQTAACL